MICREFKAKQKYLGMFETHFFVALFVLSLCPFDISVGVGAFVMGLGQISSFLSIVPKTLQVQE